MAIHHEWKEAAMTGAGVVSMGFTIYRGKNQADCRRGEIAKRVSISLALEFRSKLRPSPRCSDILPGATPLPLLDSDRIAGRPLKGDGGGIPRDDLPTSQRVLRRQRNVNRIASPFTIGERRCASFQRLQEIPVNSIR